MTENSHSTSYVLLSDVVYNYQISNYYPHLTINVSVNTRVPLTLEGEFCVYSGSKMTVKPLRERTHNGLKTIRSLFSSGVFGPRTTLSVPFIKGYQ